MTVHKDAYRSGNLNSLSTIEDIIEYAIKSEEYGFSRFWMTEHHYSFPSHPYTNPDILISIIAGMTERISVGSAGVLVNLHSPLSTLTNYKLMNNLFGNRIDLGLANAITDLDFINDIIYPKNNLENKNKYFFKTVNTICDLVEKEEAYLENEGVVIPPYKGLKPNLWYLSMSYNNGDYVIDKKLNICRSIFHNRGQDLNNLDYDRDNLLEFKEKYYKANGYYPQVALSFGYYMSDSMKKSKQYLFDQNKAIAKKDSAYIIMPTTPSHFYDLVIEYQQKFGIDEFILYDLGKDNQEKIENLAQISEMFKLQTESV